MIMSGGPEAPLIFGDLVRDERVIYLTHPLRSLGKLGNIVRKIHLATKINKYVPLPFRGIWDNSLTLNQVQFDNDTQYHIIFIITSIVKYRLEYLKKLQRKFNLNYYLYMLDSVDTENGREVKHYLDNAQLFKRIYSFDKQDCEKYGFSLMIQPLTRFEQTYKGETQFDLYFLGRPKGRLPLLVALSEKCKQQATLNFKIISNDEKEKVLLQERGWLSDYVPYEQNIREVHAANVLLELVQENQSGNTLRYQEAIIYNKKLLTNNQNIKQLPFYNPEFMKVFKSVDEIDLEWIIRRENVNYGYNDEFSAKKLIDHIFEHAN